jgi:hypothetical protein
LDCKNSEFDYIDNISAISWTTAGSIMFQCKTYRPATCKVEYGPTDAYGSAGSPKDLSVSLATLHSATLNLGQAKYHYRIICTDEHGLELESTDYTVKWDYSKPTTPVVSDDGTYTNSTTQLNASWTDSTDSDSGVVEYQYKIPNTLREVWTPVGSNRQVVVKGLKLVNGVTYKFKVKAINGGGIQSDIGESDGITVDSVAPVTSSNIDGLWHNASVIATLNPSDVLSGTNKTNYTTDGSDPETSATATIYTGPVFPFSFTLSNNGMYTVRYYSTDKAGNKEQEKNGQVMIDKTVPTVTNNTISPQKIKQPLVFKAQVTDALSGVKSVSLIIGTTSYVMAYNSTTKLYEVSRPAKTSSTSITYKFKALDNAGNTKEAATYTLSVVK